MHSSTEYTLQLDFQIEENMLNQMGKKSVNVTIILDTDQHLDFFQTQHFRYWTCFHNEMYR